MNLRKIDISERASIAYIIANILSKGISFITIPIFTRLLSTSEVGVSTTFSSWQTIIYAIVSLGLASGSFNIAMATYENQRDRYMSVSLSASTVSALLFFILAYLTRSRWEAVTSLPYATLWIMVTYMFLQPAMDYWYIRQRYENKFKSVFWVSVTSAFLSAIISVAAVIIMPKIGSGFNLATIKIESQFLVLFAYSLILYIKIFVKGKTFFDKNMLIFALKISLPLVVHSLAKNILDISDRIMIANICGQSDAGIYGTIFTISLMALIVWNAINSALVPEMFENLKKSNFVQTEKKIYRLIILFGEASVVAVLLSPEVIHLLTTREYYEAVYLMPPLFASVFLSSVYNVYGNFLLYKKCTLHIMIATLVAAGFNVVTNYFFIQLFGYMAAAYTTLASTVILAVGQGIMQKIKYKDKILDQKKIVLIGVIGTMGCLGASILFELRVVRYIIIVLIAIRFLIDTKNIIIKPDEQV